MPPSGPDRALPPPTAEGPLLDWLLDVLRPMNRTRVKQLLQHGSVSVNGTPVTRHDHPLKPGDRVAIMRGGRAAGDLGRAGVAIVYEDDAVIVIDKPTGLLTVATEAEKSDTAFARLNAHLATRKAGRPFVVHRLDRDTSGLLLFARTPAARDRLQDNWEAVTKTYLAVVEGAPRPAEGMIDNFLTEGRDLRVRATPPGGEAKRAVTRYRVVTTLGPYSLVEVGLETGRKHQIRVHLAGLGCPVIGDEVYRAATNPSRRLGLHAWRLGFDHPVTGRRVELESPLPEVLRRVAGTHGGPPDPPGIAGERL
ncbi:MAG: rluD 1 [Gemmataceae bacterium]|nr:rluD 1 [Gemmataceae bacterium]